MKTITRIITLLIPALMLVSCEKENNPGTNQEHNIFYTVSEASGLTNFTGTTVHLTTDSELEALLDHFCDYAKMGGQVMFCSTRQSNLKGNASDTPTTITTSSREELKTWMKKMEQAGKTVRVTYDEENGTWNGTAYANLGHEEMAESRLYTGTLTFVPTPVLEEPPLGGLVWAVQVAPDSTLILTLHGMVMWNENDTLDENMQIIEGAEISIEGVAGTHVDLQGNTFMTLSINVEEEKK